MVSFILVEEIFFFFLFRLTETIVLARDLSYNIICKCDVKTLYIFVAFPESLYCAITRRSLY